MFVDASALVAVLSDEAEAARVSAAILAAPAPMTSPVAILEAALALARPDKLGLSVADAGLMVRAFLADVGILVRDMPPAEALTTLALSAASRYGAGRRRLNLGDCLHYACVRHYGVPVLATDDEFRQTDLDVVP